MLRQIYPNEISNCVIFDMYFYSLEDIRNLILKYLHKYLCNGKVKILFSKTIENEKNIGLTYWELETNSVFLKEELTEIYNTQDYYIYLKLNSYDDFNIKSIK